MSWPTRSPRSTRSPRTRRPRAGHGAADEAAQAMKRQVNKVGGKLGGSAGHDPRNLLTSLVLVFPLFLVYQVGVLFTLPVLNGADFLTVFLFRDLGIGTGAYLLYTAAIAVAFGIAVTVLRRKQRFDPRLIIPVMIESAIYALTMGSLIVF